MTCNSSDKTLTSSLRFSLLKNDLKEFLYILERLQGSLQPIFESRLNIPIGTIWKIAMKLGQNPDQIRQNFTKCFVSWPYVLKIITWDPRNFGSSCVKKSCISTWYIQHLFTQRILKMIVSQVINSQSHGLEIGHFVKFCPSFGQDFDLTSWHYFI